MGHQVVVLDDGSAFLVADEPNASSTPAAPEPEAGTLSGHEVASFVIGAVASGVTFDVIKSALRALISRGRAKPAPPATAENIRDTVTGYLLGCGYLNVTIDSIRHIQGQGWTANASADDATYQGLADESGQLVHVRLAPRQ